MVVPEGVFLGLNGPDALRLVERKCMKIIDFVASPIDAHRQSATFTRWKPQVQSLQRPPNKAANPQGFAAFVFSAVGGSALA